MQYFVSKTTSSVCHISMNLYLCADNSTKSVETKGVITSDIIGSSEIRPEFKVDLQTCLTTMKEKLQCVSPFRMELYRGDSFQLLTEKPATTAKIAILLRAGLVYHTPNDMQGQGMPMAGKWIGYIERVPIRTLVLTNNIEAVGFLLAAKSVFRFGDLNKAKEIKITEYVLLETLASFSFALLGALVLNSII